MHRLCIHYPRLYTTCSQEWPSAQFQSTNSKIALISWIRIDYREIGCACYCPTTHAAPSQHTSEVRLLHLLQDFTFLQPVEGLCHYCPGRGRMVPEPPLEERLLLLSFIRGLLQDFILHRERDLQALIKSTGIIPPFIHVHITPPVSHSIQCMPQVGWS